MSLSLLQPRIDDASSFFQAPVDVLRLDLLHPVVSGNKWFKLKGYLRLAQAGGYSTLLTFGGAYSNHIVATAAAAQLKGLQSIGIIRGEQPRQLSHTLQMAAEYGMDLFFTTREEYRSKKIPATVYNRYAADSFLVVPEGGYGPVGAEGAKEILSAVDVSSYSHIVSAVGSGTTLAGLTHSAMSNQKILGISALKNDFSLQTEIDALLPVNHASVELHHNYHFGGYAKTTPLLFSFMNELYAQTSIPTDFVYTAKAFFAVKDLLQKKSFDSAQRILLIHTGGLQGNRSLPAEALNFIS